MKTYEYHYGNNWFDRLNNWLARDKDKTRTVFSWAWDNKGRYSPDDRSLFYNGAIMVRVTNGGVFLHLRFVEDHRSQFGLGYKLNGRLAVTFRPWQSDANATLGTHGPNFDQATGFNRGTA
jgi:hypothetical protein